MTFDASRELVLDVVHAIENALSAVAAKGHDPKKISQVALSVTYTDNLFRLGPEGTEDLINSTVKTLNLASSAVVGQA